MTSIAKLEANAAVTLSRRVASPASPPAATATAPAPIISGQLDAKLGIAVLDLQAIDPDSSTSVPSQKQLQAYAAPAAAPKSPSSVA